MSHEAVEIVDIHHVRQHLSDAAEAFHGAGIEEAGTWARQRRHEPDDGRLSRIAAALRIAAKAAKNEEAAAEARRCVGCLFRNRRRMRCPKFRARGICVASGVVEADCKRVVGDRLKHAGMRWTLAGANAVIALRCSRLSGRFEDFRERRAAA